MKCGTKWALLFGVGGTLLGLVLPAASLMWLLRPASPKEPLALNR